MEHQANSENPVPAPASSRRGSTLDAGHSNGTFLSEWQTSKTSTGRSTGSSQVAVRHQIKCINRSDRSNAHERITHVGSTIPEGGRWKLTQGEAIAGIESGKWLFWVNAGGKTVNVIVAVSAAGDKYLKTQNDGEQPNNLLSLPECP
jgi:hypothetical protein